MTKIMICVFCDEEANDDLGYCSCKKCQDHDGIKEVDEKEYYEE